MIVSEVSPLPVTWYSVLTDLLFSWLATAVEVSKNRTIKNILSIIGGNNLYRYGLYWLPVHVRNHKITINVKNHYPELPFMLWREFGLHSICVSMFVCFCCAFCSLSSMMLVVIIVVYFAPYLAGLSSMMRIWAAWAGCKWRPSLHNRMPWPRLEPQTF